MSITLIVIIDHNAPLLWLLDLCDCKSMNIPNLYSIKYTKCLVNTSLNLFSLKYLHVLSVFFISCFGAAIYVNRDVYEVLFSVTSNLEQIFSYRFNDVAVAVTSANTCKN